MHIIAQIVVAVNQVVALIIVLEIITIIIEVVLEDFVWVLLQNIVQADVIQMVVIKYLC
tara:strand:+ start:63 stop:239 length:177 start_codon:yes stop_codon:yes gene_type:complete